MLSILKKFKKDRRARKLAYRDNCQKIYPISSKYVHSIKLGPSELPTDECYHATSSNDNEGISPSFPPSFASNNCGQPYSEINEFQGSYRVPPVSDITKSPLSDNGNQNSPSPQSTILTAKSLISGSSNNLTAISTNSNGSISSKSRIFPSTRFFIALLLCLCYIALSISTSNISLGMVCMVKRSSTSNTNIPPKRGSTYNEKSTDQRYTGTNVDIYARNTDEMNHPDGPWLKSGVGNADSELSSMKIKSEHFLGSESSSVENGLQVERMASRQKSPEKFIQRLKRHATNTNLRNPHDSANVSQNFYKTTLSDHVKTDEAVNGCEAATRIKKHAFDTGLGQQNHLSEEAQKELEILIESCHEAEKLRWSSTDQGMVFAAQNAGSLLMLFTGSHADRLNGKWTIVVALFLLVLSNVLLPYLTTVSIWSVFAIRLLTGFADALLQPSTSSLITRWFPPKERPFAIGLITGGRQIGTLMILPVAGFLCTRHDIMKGWPAIFYLSALIASLVLIIWLFCAADKPSKHCCTSVAERYFIEHKIAEEKIGKRTERRKVPWKNLATCVPMHVAVFALICHEYPLVIMLQLLPIYVNDILKFSTVTNGIVSALPIAVLFISKTLSSSLSSYIQARKNARFQIGRTPLVKLFNGIASFGLGICVGIVPLFNHEDQKIQAIVLLCMANAFAGLHTPGVQTALLQIAPAYTGIVTGIAFGFVGIFGIINKVLSNFIVSHGSVAEWTLVFWIAAIVALLPVLVFSLWGSADRQSWASNGALSRNKKRHSIMTNSSFSTIIDVGRDDFHKTDLLSSRTTPNLRQNNEHITVTVIEPESPATKKKPRICIGNVNDAFVEIDGEQPQQQEAEEEDEEGAIASALRLQIFLTPNRLSASAPASPVSKAIPSVSGTINNSLHVSTDDLNADHSRRHTMVL